MEKNICLEQIKWPETESLSPPVPISIEEYESRLIRLYEIMEKKSLTHVVIYGDREHFANILYMTGYDPRFEETLLIISKDTSPLILVGNEGDGYVAISPLVRDGKIRTEKFQALSLQNQPRGSSRFLNDIFLSEKINEKAIIGIIGIKFYLQQEINTVSPSHIFDIPSYVVDILRDMAGYENVLNVTEVLTHPSSGMRSKSSAAEIAYFEYTNSLATVNVRNIFFGLKEGISDLEAVKNAQLEGIPQGCHIVFCTGKNLPFGMTSPSGESLIRGQGAAFNVSYRGSNICRAGWLAYSDADLPVEAQDYLEAFAIPYFSAMVQWLQLLTIGASGGDIYNTMSELLPFDTFGVFLNPGHLIHYDEWIGSPIYKDSLIPLQSGMVFQSDIIPSSPVYFSSRMEEGYFLADSQLIQEIKENYPDTYRRVLARKNNMKETLGITLPEDLYPLSDISGIIAPFFFNPNQVLVIQN